MKFGLLLLLSIYAEDAPVAGPSPPASDMGNQVQNQVDKVSSNAADSFKTQGDQNNKAMGQVAGNQKFASSENGTMNNSTSNDATNGTTVATNDNKGTMTANDGICNIPVVLILFSLIFATVVQ